MEGVSVMEERVSIMRNDTMYLKGPEGLLVVVDTGATMEGVISKYKLPRGYGNQVRKGLPTCVKMGNGQNVWSEGEVDIPIDWNGNTQHCRCLVLDTNAFECVVGMRFLDKVSVEGVLLNPPALLLKNGDKVVR